MLAGSSSARFSIARLLVAGLVSGVLIAGVHAPTPAQDDVPDPRSRTGIAISHRFSENEDVQRAFLTLLEEYGAEELERTCRRALQGRRVIANRILGGELPNGFTAEFYLTSNRRAYEAFEARFDPSYRMVARRDPVVRLFERAAPKRRVLRVWQQDSFDSDELVELVEQALFEHYEEDDPDALLDRAQRSVRSKDFFNAIVQAERALELQPTERHRARAQTIVEGARKTLAQAAKRKLVKVEGGFEKSDVTERVRTGTIVQDERGKKKYLHPHLTIVFPDDKQWRDLDRRSFGAKLPHGVAVFITGAYYRPSTSSTKVTITIDGRRMDPSNRSRIAQSLQKGWEREFKRIIRSRKPDKFEIERGRCAAFDMIVQGGKGRGSFRLLDRFTALGAALDATRSFNPREIEMHFRQLVIVGKKRGTHTLLVCATRDCFRKDRREIERVLRTLEAN